MQLVNETTLNSGLTSIANAIRTKGGTVAQLSFPTGFVNAVNAISGGGGVDVNIVPLLTGIVKTVNYLNSYDWTQVDPEDITSPPNVYMIAAANINTIAIANNRLGIIRSGIAYPTVSMYTRQGVDVYLATTSGLTQLTDDTASISDYPYILVDDYTTPTKIYIASSVDNMSGAIIALI